MTWYIALLSLIAVVSLVGVGWSLLADKRLRDRHLDLLDRMEKLIADQEAKKP